MGQNFHDSPIAASGRFESRHLKISTDTAHRLETGLRESLDGLDLSGVCPATRDFGRFRCTDSVCTTAADWFDEAAGHHDGDFLTIVLRALHEPLAGVSMLALCPSELSAWAGVLGPGAHSLKAFVEQVDSLLISVVKAATAGLGTSLPMGDARFGRQPLLASVAGTHAPRDTVLMSARLSLPRAGSALAARFCLLATPKSVTRLL